MFNKTPSHPEYPEVKPLLLIPFLPFSSASTLLFSICFLLLLPFWAQNHPLLLYFFSKLIFFFHLFQMGFLRLVEGFKLWKYLVFYFIFWKKESFLTFISLFCTILSSNYRPNFYLFSNFDFFPTCSRWVFLVINEKFNLWKYLEFFSKKRVFFNFHFHFLHHFLFKLSSKFLSVLKLWFFFTYFRRVVFIVENFKLRKYLFFCFFKEFFLTLILLFCSSFSSNHPLFFYLFSSFCPFAHISDGFFLVTRKIQALKLESTCENNSFYVTLNVMENMKNSGF